jgi:hypothetical protein
MLAIAFVERSLDLSTEPMLADDADEPPTADEAARPPDSAGIEAEASTAATATKDFAFNFIRAPGRI